MRSSMLGIDGVHTIMCMDSSSFKSICKRFNSYEGTSILKSLLEELIVIKFTINSCIETQFAPEELSKFTKDVNYSLSVANTVNPTDVADLSFDVSMTDIFNDFEDTSVEDIDDFSDLDSNEIEVSDDLESDMEFDSLDNLDDFDDLDEIDISIGCEDGYHMCPDNVNPEISLTKFQIMRIIGGQKIADLSDEIHDKVITWSSHMKRTPTGRVLCPFLSDNEIQLNSSEDLTEYPELQQVFLKLQEICNTSISVDENTTVSKIDNFINIIQASLDSQDYNKKLFEYPYYSLNNMGSYQLSLKLYDVIQHFQNDSFAQCKKKYINYINDCNFIFKNCNNFVSIPDLNPTFSYDDFKNKISSRTSLDGVPINIELLDTLHRYISYNDNGDEYFKSLVKTELRTLLTLLLLAEQVNNFKTINELFDLNLELEDVQQINKLLTEVFSIIGFNDCSKQLLFSKLKESKVLTVEKSCDKPNKELASRMLITMRCLSSSYVRRTLDA